MATAVRTVQPAELAREEVDAYLRANQQKSLLRLLTCGSVDDGKSTLIGRMLYDSKTLFEDQLAALDVDSRNGLLGGEIDFSLLVDGLAAEREQGITIDVAYRFFATDRRKFIIADTPGHEQYTRNMVTGASTADLAIILVDARKGILNQTRRHSFIVHLLGIRNIVLAVNKMDLVGHDQGRFDEIVADYGAFARDAGIRNFVAIPVSAKSGDNVATPSVHMDWYDGPALLEHLETVPVGARLAADRPFRMPVQWVNRPSQDFRGYSGTIVSGTVRTGDPIAIFPSGRSSAIDRIVTFDGDREEAIAGQAVTLTFRDEVDCSRGEMIGAPGAARVANQLEANLVWMAEAAMVPHRAYWLKFGTQLVSGEISTVKGVMDIGAMEERGTLAIDLNDIGNVQITLDRPIAAVPYAEDRQLGGFIMIDKISNATIAAGMISSFVETEAANARPDHDATHIFWIDAADDPSRSARAQQLQSRLHSTGRTAFILDEQTAREGICLDVAPSDHVELVRRVAAMARLMSRAGVTVIICVPIAPGASVPGVVISASNGGEDAVEDWII